MIPAMAATNSKSPCPAPQNRSTQNKRYRLPRPQCMAQHRANSAGGRLPRALCGRRSSFLCQSLSALWLHGSSICKHSSRKRLLNDSAEPFCQGVPFSTYKRCTPQAENQFFTARLTNSLEKWRGRKIKANASHEHSGQFSPPLRGKAHSLGFHKPLAQRCGTSRQNNGQAMSQGEKQD